jgi:hypothetical protein
VWQPRGHSPFHADVLEVVLRAAAAAGSPLQPSPPDSGPFSVGTPDVALGVLQDSGWANAEFTPHVLSLQFAPPGASPAGTAASLLAFGSLEVLLRGAPAPGVDAARRAVEADVAASMTADGIWRDGAIAILTATNPG